MLRLELPYLPPVEFSPNSRGYWTQRHIAGRKAKDDIWALVHAEGWQGPPLSGATVVVSWGLPTKKTIDWDNLVARTKPFIDGLVDAGVLVGDSVRDYQPEYRWYDSPRKPQTVIEVKPQCESPLVPGPGLPLGQLGHQGATMGLTGPTTGC